MLADTDNVRIREIRALLTPDEVTAEFVRSETATRTVTDARRVAARHPARRRRSPRRRGRALLDP